MTVAQARQAKKLAVGALGWAVALPIFVVGLSLLLSSTIMPFRPYELHSYEIVPLIRCPGEPTDFEYAATLTKPRFGEVTRITTYSRWVRADGQGPRQALESDPRGFSGEYGYREGVSTFARYAPDEPGRWRVEVSITTYGYVTLWPVQHVVGPVRTDVLTVLDPSDERCNG